MNSILEGLNNKQKDAVTAIDGRIKVIAGAGSGKTKTLAHRYAFLVEEVGINPANILCLTFTNKAAQEMKSRIAKMVHVGNYNDFVSTIHGFCVKLLRKEIFRIGYPPSFTILDEEDMKLLAKEVMTETGEDRTNTSIKQFLVNVAKTKAKSYSSYNNFYINMYLVPESQQDKVLQQSADRNSSFCKFLMKQQKAYGIDFQDIIYFALYLLQNFSDVKKYWQNQFDYVMVDETQDCNRNDWTLIEILSEINNNLFVVGDPDQAIYEWRGANPTAFVKFEQDDEIILDENYRSTQSILDVANCVIENNKNRIKKDLFTRKESKSNVIHFHAKSEQEEAQYIAKEIKKIQNEGNSLSDIAILYRMSYISRSFEQELMRVKLPYVIYGGIRFFERKEIKDALSYLRLICSEDDLSFTRIINVPSRKLGDTYKKKISDLAEIEGTTLYRTLVNHINEKTFAKPTAVEFVSIIEEAKQKVSTLSISDLLQNVLKNSGYDEMLRNEEDTDRQDNLKELVASIISYEQINSENDISLSTYLQDIALYTNLDYKDNVEGAVKLMTIHQSKGLEFPYVFVVGLSEGIMPSHRAIRERRESALEEERRLMYVAITRAEKALCLTESEGFNFTTKYDKYPSRFLTEIKRNFFITEGKIDDSIWRGTKDLVSQLDKELSFQDYEQEYEVNDIVYNKFFGKGKVLSYDEESKSYKVKFGKSKKNVLPQYLSDFKEETPIKKQETTQNSDIKAGKNVEHP